jgi:hypothetical protein
MDSRFRGNDINGVGQERKMMASPRRFGRPACRLGGGYSIISSVRFQFFLRYTFILKLPGVCQFIADVLEYLNGGFGLFPDTLFKFVNDRFPI